ncbi:hypothetical protein GYMLUDRAFT_60979 [Collybiopsis luxurians FD-317 M1]|uniref:Uncharacterized protein n=1 Tax=Collybiopsis luxurians FD-317 M1 TaxID=944289 RepID=A0A0D0BRN4_9AGAR|nr:hypothetical protein GYMLUDRAFT_60979 [Collybiopsis luxurians FD-317 M1]
MADIMWNSLEKYKIVDCIIALVMDNALNNDAMVEAFADKCILHNIPLSERNAHMHCMPHTIHLAALKLLEAIGGVSHSSQIEEPYQDSVTVPVGCGFDDDAVVQQDNGDNETDITTLKYAIGKDLVLGTALKDCLSCA